jgi:hypothetical protein
MEAIMYKLTNGQVEQVTSLPNVSGVELYLQSLPVNERQAMGIFSHVEYGAHIEAFVSVADDCIYAPTPVPPEIKEQPFAISKIKLGDAFEALGVIGMFQDFIASNPTTARRYRDAVVLMSDDPMVTGAMGYFKDALKLNDDQIKNLLEGCKSDI